MFESFLHKDSSLDGTQVASEAESKRRNEKTKILSITQQSQETTSYHITSDQWYHRASQAFHKSFRSKSYVDMKKRKKIRYGNFTNL